MGKFNSHQALVRTLGWVEGGKVCIGFDFVVLFECTEDLAESLTPALLQTGAG